MGCTVVQDLSGIACLFNFGFSSACLRVLMVGSCSHVVLRWCPWRTGFRRGILDASTDGVSGRDRLGSDIDLLRQGGSGGHQFEIPFQVCLELNWCTDPSFMDVSRVEPSTSGTTSNRRQLSNPGAYPRKSLLQNPRHSCPSLTSYLQQSFVFSWPFLYRKSHIA